MSFLIFSITPHLYYCTLNVNEIHTERKFLASKKDDVQKMQVWNSDWTKLLKWSGPEVLYNSL